MTVALAPHPARPAAVLARALERLGHRKWALYEGSGAEWGMFPTVPVATGAA